MRTTVKTIKADLEAINHIAEVSVSYNSKIKPSDRAKISSSSDSYKVIWDASKALQLELKEFFYILLMDRANKVLGVVRLGEGSAFGCVVDIQQLIRASILCNAQNIILWHNHPSGNMNPSEADKAITKKTKQALALVEINLLDHLIITSEEGRYTSFQDEGLI
jgi:hypothetical protein